MAAVTEQTKLVIVLGTWVDDNKHRLGYAYVEQDAQRTTLTVCARCGEALEKAESMERWKYDGRQWRHKCQRARIIWRKLCGFCDKPIPANSAMGYCIECDMEMGW